MSGVIILMRIKQKIFKNKKTICFAAAIVVTLCGSLVFAGMAAERSGMYWTNFNGGGRASAVGDNKGFIMVDVSDAHHGSTRSAESAEDDTEVVSLGIGPTPSIPTLTTEELKLYGILSKGDGFLTSEDMDELNKDIHWREVVLEKDDTIETIAREYGIAASDIRIANELKAGDNLKYAEVLYIPDGKAYITHTLAYVRKLKKAEEDFKKQGKPVDVSTHVVQNGDSLWSIATKYNLELDTIIGSNKLNNVNVLKLGMELRIPNQDGIFVKVARRDSVAKLAEKYGSYKEAIYVANMLPENSSLVVGKEIFLPGAKLIVAAAERSAQGNNTVRNTTTVITSVPGAKLRWPLVGQISSNYGWRRSPFGRRRVFHSGLDIRAPRGREIVAAAGGTVVHSGWMGGYGYTIVIAHSNGLTTLYGHCSSLVATKGQTVRSGELIARVGSTGRSTGNHLHFEVRIKGTTYNPLSYLR